MTRKKDPERQAVAQEFGRKLENLLVEREWNQSDLARHAERVSGTRVGRDSISNYVRGEVLPGPVHLNAMAIALGIRPDDLLPQDILPWRRTEAAFELREIGDGRVFLKLTKAMSFQKATKIVNVLQESD